jgi:hypothetical protein
LIVPVVPGEVKPERKEGESGATKGAKQPEENQKKGSPWHLRGFYGIF